MIPSALARARQLERLVDRPRTVVDTREDVRMEIEHASHNSRVTAETLSVLHVSQPVDGGVGRTVSQLVADQVARGWRVAVASPADVEAPLGEFLAHETLEQGAEHLRWQATRSPGYATVSETRRLARIVSGRRPDLVHLHSSKAGLAGRLALRGRVPTVFQPHAWSFLALRGSAQRAGRGWERLAARWCDAIVCVSEGERAIGTAAGISANWRVIPNAVDLERIEAASDADRAEARRELGLPVGPLVVCVGRLSRQKGQDLLLAAWLEVLARVPSAALVLVGDGPDRRALEEGATPGVRFAGARDDVPSWLAAADVVAVPSRWEGMTLAMIEAMARGRSVVATDAAGADALPSAGAVVPGGDAAALAEALAARLLDPARRSEEERANRAAAEASHDLRRAAGAIVELYRDVLERRAGGGRSDR